MFQNVQQIQDFIRQNGIAFLDFKMIDLRGRWKHLSIPAARFNEDIMTHGIGFDGSNYGYAQVERSDMVFLPDITTAVVDPFVKAPTLTMIGDVMVIDHPANRPFDQYPRNVAKSAIAHMQALGVADEMIIGPEYEFHVFDGMTRTLRPGCRRLPPAVQRVRLVRRRIPEQRLSHRPARWLPRRSARRPHV